MTTSRGSLLEKLYQLGDLECAICHDGEALQFYQADKKELETALKVFKVSPDANSYELENKLEAVKFQISKRQEIIKRTTELRRRLMNSLEMENDRDWCSCKHYGTAVTRALEIYETDFSQEHYEQLVETYEIWAMRLSLYFNIQYTECFRCVSDKLKKSS